MKIYQLMHRNDKVCDLRFDDLGKQIDKMHVISDNLLPLQGKRGLQGINRWWNQRSVPISQKGIQKILERAGVEGAGEFLLKNRQVIDFDKLPSQFDFEEIYAGDPESEIYLPMIREGFQKKVEMIRF